MATVPLWKFTRRSYHAGRAITPNQEGKGKHLNARDDALSRDAVVIVGIVVGLLIGAISGTVFLLLLRSANQSTTSAQKTISLTAEILAIPTFWFGGKWVSTDLLNQADLADFINPYVIALALCFFLFCSYPAFRWIGSLANELGTARTKP
jgi:hypothetical protein